MYITPLLTALTIVFASTTSIANQDEPITLDNNSVVSECTSYSCQLTDRNVSFAMTSSMQVGVFNSASARIACEVAQDMGIADDITITISTNNAKTTSECSNK